MRRVCIEMGHVMVARQLRQMRAACVPLCRVTRHDDMGNTQRRAHGFGRAGMHFVVQGNALWVLQQVEVRFHW